MSRKAMWSAACLGILLAAALAYVGADQSPSRSAAKDRGNSNEGDELSLLRHRLDNLERQQETLSAQTPLQVAPAQTGVSSEEAKLSGEHEAVDQEELGRRWLVRYHALSDVIDEEVAIGTRDAWAVETEATIATALAESFPQSHLQEIACSEAACKFEASHESPQARSEAVDDLPYKIEGYFDEIRHELSDSSDGEKIVTWRMIRKGSTEYLSSEAEKKLGDDMSI